MVACYLCIDWCIQQHSCGNTIMYYVTIKFSSSGWCAPCCTGVLRTLLFCWRQRLMPLVRMKMGTHHWYTVTSLLIVFFFNCLHHSLASLPPRKEAYCTLNKRLVLDVYGKSRPHGVRNKFLYRLSWPQ